MSKCSFPALFAMLAAAGLSAHAATIDSAGSSVSSAAAGVATPVLFTANISDNSVIPGSVNLLRIDATGRATVIGRMYDDATHGDATAGDQIYSLQLNVFEQTTGTVNYRVSAGFLGSLVRNQSGMIPVTISGVSTGITITSPTVPAFLSISPTTVTGTVGDPGATVKVNGITAQVNSGTFTASIPLQEGTNTLTAVATNSNSSVTTDSRTVNLDTTPPHVTIDSPVNNAVTLSSAINITGIVNDIVVGTVNDQQATVTVNGVPAQVSNRTYVAAAVPLVMGTNTITSTGRDRAGNFATASITVVRQSATQPGMTIVSGNNLTGSIGTLLASPLVVQLLNGSGQPLTNTSVVFSVTGGDGTVSATASTGLSSVAVNTNAQGQAQAFFKLGSRSGAGNNLVTASAAGVQTTAVFTESASASAASLIVVDSGNSQSGVVGQALPLPFIAIVTDAGHNRLGGVSVTFDATQGGGSFGGQPTLTATTDSDGRVQAILTLGAAAGPNTITANFAGNAGLPATFSATGLIPGPPANTTITGVVLDNSNIAIPGVTMRLYQTNSGANNNVPQQVGTTVQTNAQGFFQIAPAPVGVFKLMADGTTATRPGAFPTLEYDLVTVAGQNNTVGSPIYLPQISAGSQLCVTATTGGTLTVPQAPGFALTIAPGSATFPGGTRTGCVSVTPVNSDKIPMVPGFGQQPRFIVTIQPVGTIFNPPAAITIPNVDGLAPRAITEMYSYDHDLAAFTAIGTGTVSVDGSVIASDPGVGVIKAGWHCGGDPNTAGSVAALSLSVTPGNITAAVDDVISVTANGAPPLDASYSWEIVATQPGDDTTMATLLSSPSCANSASCVAQVKIVKPGGATLRVHFICSTTGLQVTQDVRISANEIRFLDVTDNPIDTSTGALKVSKFVTNVTLNATDTDNFKVQVTDGSVGGNTLTVDLTGKTSAGAADTLPGITLTKVAGTNKFRSDFLRLVIDDVDKAAAPNQALKTGTGGTVEAAYAGPPQGKAKINVCKPADIKTVTVGVVILRTKALAAGGTPVVTTASAQADFDMMNRVYAQVCVKISSSITVADPPAGVDLSDGLTEFADPASPTAEEKALFDGLATAVTTDVQAFYVNTLSSGSYAEAFTPSSLAGGNAKYANNVIISAGRTPFSPAHELGHVLTNDGSHSAVDTNLMKGGGTSTVNSVTASKRLNTTQETQIRGNALAQ